MENPSHQENMGNEVDSTLWTKQDTAVKVQAGGTTKWRLSEHLLWK